VSEFVGLEGEFDANALEQESISLIESRFEGWHPASGDLLVWLVKAWVRICSGLYDQASLMSRAAFQKFGETVASVPPIQAAPATVESVWTMVDSAGYTIPASTQVAVAASGETQIGFLTVEEVTVAPESTKATVLLRAIEPGTEGNGLSGAVELVDALAFVESIELEGVTSGGVDEEEEDAYLNRLVEELQLRSLSLIIGRDFEIDARSIAGIARAKCIEAYNAKEGKEEAMAVSVYPIDEAGAASSSPVREALEERQKAKLLSGINYYVGTPDYTEIDGEATIVVLQGFDPATVLAAVEARWAEYFNPAKWGIPSQGDSGSGWENRIAVYYNEVISELDRVSGVDRVASLKIAKHGKTLGTADLELTGKVPLTKPGTFTVEAL
jgi:hypothetical protein